MKTLNTGKMILLNSNFKEVIAAINAEKSGENVRLRAENERIKEALARTNANIEALLEAKGGGIPEARVVHIVRTLDDNAEILNRVDNALVALAEPVVGIIEPASFFRSQIAKILNLIRGK